MTEWATPRWIADWKDGGPPDPRGNIDTASLIAAQPELAGVDVRELAIPGVPARLYHSPEPSGELLVWVHGGAYVTGSLDMPEANWVALALAARGIDVVSVDYRKALRGVSHPLPSDDVLTAWQWALGNAPDGRRLSLGGASAGAALAAGAVLRLRDEGRTMPASLVLAYPIVHPKLPELNLDITENIEELVPSLVFTHQLVDEMSRNYVGEHGDLEDPHAFAGNGTLTPHPPAYILNSERDALRASGELYGKQLAEAGAIVTVDLEPGTTHGHLDQPHCDGAKRSIDRIVTWLIGIKAPRDQVDVPGRP